MNKLILLLAVLTIHSGYGMKRVLEGDAPVPAAKKQKLDESMHEKLLQAFMGLPRDKQECFVNLLEALIGEDEKFEALEKCFQEKTVYSLSKVLMKLSRGKSVPHETFQISTRSLLYRLAFKIARIIKNEEYGELERAYFLMQLIQGLSEKPYDQDVIYWIKIMTLPVLDLFNMIIADNDYELFKYILEEEPDTVNLLREALKEPSTTESLSDSEDSASESDDFELASPLVQAIKSNRIEFALGILDTCKDISPPYLKPAFHAACDGNNAVIFRRLIERGTYDAHQAVLWAIERDDWELMHYLIQCGVLTKAFNKYLEVHYDLLHILYGILSPKMMEILILGGGELSEEVQVEYYTHLLCVATMKDEYLDFMRILIDDHGVDYEEGIVEDADGDPKYISALYYCAKNGCWKAADYLIKRGANVQHDIYGSTPLHCAVKRGYKEMVQLLLDAGAPVNHRDRRGNTPLGLAILSGNELLVECLIAGGAEVNAPDGGGDTPLELAIRQDSDAIVKCLIARGANVNERNSLEWSLGQTPLDLAIRLGRTDLVALLLDAGAQSTIKNWFGYGPIQSAIFLGNVSIVEIIAKRADINAPDKYGVTPLELAISIGNQSIVECLMTAGADVNLKDALGYTLLDKAIIKNDIDVVKSLVNHGAALDTVNARGLRPHDFAAKMHHMELAAWLKERFETKLVDSYLA